MSRAFFPKIRHGHFFDVMGIFSKKWYWHQKNVGKNTGFLLWSTPWLYKEAFNWRQLQPKHFEETKSTRQGNKKGILKMRTEKYR